MNLGNVQGTFFWWYLQGLITTSYISKKITKFTVFARGGGEGDGDGELEMLELIFEHSSEWGGYQNWTSANKGEGGVQNLGILWERNNWMSPNDAYKKYFKQTKYHIKHFQIYDVYCLFIQLNQFHSNMSVN